jgi:CRP-like cAMP-binding protein
MDDVTDAPLEKFIRDYAALEVIFEENSPGAEMFVVHSGKVRLFTRGEDGEEVTLATVEEGGFFGEMTLIDKSPRSATAVAEEDARLVVLDRPRFLYMIRQQPKFAFAVMGGLCGRIREANAALARARAGERPQ